MMSKIVIETVSPEAVTKELQQVNTASGIGDESALALRGQFGAYYNEIVSWRNQAATITDPENIEQQAIARTVRLGLRKTRCDVENTRKALKADSLARGKAIDGFANVLKYLCEPVEAQLLDVEQYAERHAEARIAAIVAERTANLVDAEADPTAYNLGAMDDDTFALVLAGIVKKRDDRIEDERKAEADKIKAEADAKAENERIRIENKKLIAVAGMLKAEADAERKAAAAKTKTAEDKAKAEREAREKVERDAAAAKAKADADLKAKLAAAAAEARAPDRDKITAMAVKMRAATLPDMATDEGRAVMVKIAEQREKFAGWIDGLAEKM